MYLLPYKRETVVLPFSTTEALLLIGHVTEPVSMSPSKDDKKFLFNGMIYDKSFKISRKINYPQNFLPLIKGQVEETRLGSILFVEYELFFSSRMFLTVWSVLCILIALFFSIYPKEYMYAVIALLAGSLNYAVSWMNFNKQVKDSHAALCKALALD